MLHVHSIWATPMSKTTIPIIWWKGLHAALTICNVHVAKDQSNWIKSLLYQPVSSLHHTGIATGGGGGGLNVTRLNPRSAPPHEYASSLSIHWQHECVPVRRAWGVTRSIIVKCISISPINKHLVTGKSVLLWIYRRASYKPKHRNRHS